MPSLFRNIFRFYGREGKDRGVRLSKLRRAKSPRGNGDNLSLVIILFCRSRYERYARIMGTLSLDDGHGHSRFTVGCFHAYADA